jgi:peptidyl-prolyl cis-trans isomerase B (cyclophilin B)
MKSLLLSCFLVCTLGLASVRGQESSPAQEKKPTETNQKEVAVLKTSDGVMVAEFWSDVAPKTVENFKKLARQGFYDGTAFHRVIRGFMIQGGDPNTKDPSKEAIWGRGGPGYTIPAEFNNKPHIRGVLSMARLEDPNSAGSQFFICIGTASSLDHKYTAFGRVIKGDDVLDKIGATPVTRAPDGETSKPQTRVTLESVKIVPADSVK